ncbi:MAG: choice-of-anchor Q domain-containing protein [Solirubrobacteraceae bacterium]
MRYRGALGWLIGLTVMLVVPSTALAATVTTTADSGAGSLRDAIAGPDSTIDFAGNLSGQTITLTSGALMITHNLTISGPGASNLTVVGDGSDPVFEVNIVPATSTSATISGLTITGGRARDIGGGGISATSVATLTLDGDVITGNQSTLRTNGTFGGGGVFVNGGNVSVSNSTITNNTVTFTDTVSGANNASGGGGLYSDGGDVTVTGSDVSHNTVDLASSSGDNGGGGIYSNGGAVEFDVTTVRDNSVHITASPGGDDGGGGIYSNGGAVSLEQAAVDGNSFTLDNGTGGNYGGGGVYDHGGGSTVGFSTIDGNSVTVSTDTGGDDGGGGLLGEGGDIGVGFSSISNNTVNVTDNTGGDDGGGAILDKGGTNVYLVSTFSGNSVTISGGSIDNGGGALYSFGDSQISSLTIAGNSSNVAGGAIVNRSALQFENTIVANNTAAPAGNCAGSGTFTSHGFNLESANTCGFNGGGDLVNRNPLLGPLQNNGGPTPTMALPAGSPVVDAGTCTDIVGASVPIDQRGVARPQPTGGKCDIGAYELTQDTQPPPPPAAKPAAVPGNLAATSTTKASFSATVNPEGQATTVFFQYGLDTSDRPPGGPSGIVYDQSTSPQSLPPDSNTHTVTASVSGLVPNAHYHVRLVATNATGTTFGADQTFTTPADPPPPAPVLSKSVNAKPVSGKVFLLVGGKLVPLNEADQLRSGTVVDTRHGSLQLTTATSQKGKRQIGTFSGAIFKITQVHSGLTTLSLMENAFSGAPTFASCSTKGAHATAVSKRVLQLLHSSAKGKFRTKGRYAAATVRGTKWTIADRCDGTLTHDLTDSVVVNDFVAHKTIVLHAGQSYLAKSTPPKKKTKK